MADLICTPMGGKGKLLTDFLIEQLGLPKNCVGFDVHFSAGEPITITTRTFARDDGAVDAFDGTPVATDTRQFVLVEQPKPADAPEALPGA